MVELNITEDMKSKGPVEATFWSGIKVGPGDIFVYDKGHMIICGHNDKALGKGGGPAGKPNFFV
jgi:hypothetical protein